MATVSKQSFLITPIATGDLGHFLVVMMTTRGLKITLFLLKMKRNF